jgi:8-oxo-dGTP pyrophosphatase MutT (NUDIX family)
LQIAIWDDSEWALPAGACEPGDSFRTTAVKELFEETGLAVEESHLTPFASISDPTIHTIRYPNGDVVHAFALCFWVLAPLASVHGGDGEACEFAWSDPRLTLPKPTYRATIETVNLYLKYVETGLFQAA